jgi:hypothetical protein
MIKNKNTKKIILILLAVVFAGTIAYVAYASLYSNNNDTITTDNVNLDPPTEEEKAETEAHKDKVVNRQDIESQDRTNTSSAKKDANVTISSWPSSVSKNQDVDVSGFVSNVYESGGKCTLTLRKGARAVSKSRTAMKDAQTTACGFITIKRAALSTGTWRATITYSSTTAQGISQTIGIEVK